MTLIETRNNWDKQLHYLNGKPVKTLSINNMSDFETFKNSIRNYNLQSNNWLIYANGNHSQAKNIEQMSDLNFL